MSCRIIQTRHGREMDLLHPKAEDVDIRDIAYGLSQIPRFSGQAPFYTVAQHSILMATFIGETARDFIRPEWSEQARSLFIAQARLAALMHDAHEAYMGDITGPARDSFEDGQTYSRVELLKQKIQKVIDSVFGVDTVRFHDVLRIADQRMVVAEAKYFFGVDLNMGVEGYEMRPDIDSPTKFMYSFMQEFNRRSKAVLNAHFTPTTL